jgi:CubicO group peptidase (beta-lactamase class C family)
MHAGDALLVWQDDSLALEAYQNGYDADAPHRLNSGTKTFAGLMALAAVEDGLLTLDEPVAQTITAWQGDPQKATITVRHLLHLTSGLQTSVGLAPGYAEAIAKPLVHAPGTAFRYGPTAFQVFGALLERKLGGEDVRAYLQRRILDPLGVQSSSWGTTLSGDPNLAAGASMTASGWLRIGRLLLNDGRWAGQPILAPATLDALTQPADAAPGYGLAVWLNAAVDPADPFFDGAPPDIRADGPEGMIYAAGPGDLYMAAGAANQRLYVIPSRAMVVVRFGRWDDAWSDAAFLARLLDGEAYAAAASSAARSAQTPDADALARLQLAGLHRAVDLTPAQAGAVRPALRRRAEVLLDVRPILRDAAAGRRARRRAARRLRTVVRETDRTIEGVLTPEQEPRYRAWKEAQRERFERRE